MSSPLHFRDWLSFGEIKIRSDALQFFEDVAAEHGRDVSLILDSPATWSGYLLNGRTYPGVHMQEGVRTWCDAQHGGIAHFNRPVLTHHNMSEGEPIGRVVKATFTPLIKGDAFLHDYENPARDGDEGSGVTTLSMRITDAAAVGKFLRGEYATFSTSFSSTHMICTVCNKNIKQDGWCGHVPGKVYELEEESDAQAECYFVTGPMFYKEVSVVNDPAQPRAVVQNMRLSEGLQDGAEYPAMMDRRPGHPVMILQDAATGTRTRLTLTDGEQDVIPSGRGKIRRRTQVQIPDSKPLTPEDIPTEPEVKTKEALRALSGNEDFALAHIAHALKEQGLLKTDDEVSVADVAVVRGEPTVFIAGLTELDKGHDHVHTMYLQIDMKRKVLHGWTEGTFPVKEKDDPIDHTHSVEIPIKDLNADLFEGSSRDASRGDNHTHEVRVVMHRDAQGLGPAYTDLLELIEEYRDDIESDRVWDEVFTDKRLTAKERKRLKSSTFCGPNKSFPVPDCAHVTAARRLIGRYKGSAETKKRILSCVSGRAKKLGCGGSDAGKLATERTTMTTPNKGGDPSGAGGAPASTDADKTKLNERIGTLTDQIGELTGQLKDLQAQKDQKDQELTDVTKQLSDSQSEIQRITALNLALMRAVSGHADAKGLDTFTKVERYADTLQERQLASLQDAIKDEGQAFASRLTAFGKSGGGVDPKITDATTPEGRALVRKDEPEPETKKTNPLEKM